MWIVRRLAGYGVVVSLFALEMSFYLWLNLGWNIAALAFYIPICAFALLIANAQYNYKRDVAPPHFPGLPIFR